MYAFIVGSTMTVEYDLVQTSRYRDVSDEKASGATYTPKALADFVADGILQTATGTLKHRPIKILDPATGDGELLISLLEKLHDACLGPIEVHGFETDGTALANAQTRINRRFPDVSVHLKRRNFLDFVLEHVRPHDFGGLFEGHSDGPTYDLIIANPPYVRTQIMGAAQAQLIASQFGLAGRVDLYFAFIVGMAFVLKPGGTGGFIVSNRFMTTKSGSAVRQAIRKYFAVQHVWDLGDTKLFGAAVLPAVLLVKKNEQNTPLSAGFTSIYATTKPPSFETATVIEALGFNGVVKIGDGRRFEVKSGCLDTGMRSDAVWRVSTSASDNWLTTVKANTWRRFGDVGKVRVGVKTCADKVYTRTDWDDMSSAARPELLRLLTTHHVARRFRASTPKKTRHILYPHETRDGKRSAVNLEKYPRSAAYLQAHRRTLEGRTYVLEAGRQWFEIWVPQDPASWDHPKLVFRDISESPTFWIDLDGTIVNGDCYWMMTEKGGDTDHLWLAVAVANSSFIESFYDRSFNNKLYAGRRRFITQYVEQFPLPDPTLPSSHLIVALAKQIYEQAGDPEANDIGVRLEKLIWNSFGVLPDEEIAG